MSINNNFLNNQNDDDSQFNQFFQENQYNQNETIDDIVEDSLQETMVLSEAVKRIEQAKLYETFLKHKLFAEGSARPEIIQIVETELKQFILSRLEILLGIKPEKPTPNQQVQSIFTDEEINALKQLAGRVLQKTTQPTINPVQNSAPQNISLEPQIKPTINPVQATQPVINKIPTQNNTPKPQLKKQAVPKNTNASKRRSNNVSQVIVETTDGQQIPINQDYSQVSLNNKSMTPADLEAAMALQAQKEVNNILSGNSTVGQQLLQNLIKNGGQ
jgi:hypothetical protein